MSWASLPFLQDLIDSETRRPLTMLRDGELIGIIAVTRTKPRRTTEDQIALLETFADQAVIAIENVRLFKADAVLWISD